jgi:hypothetical protein
MAIAALVRSRDTKVFGVLAEFGKQSLRKIAQATGLSKDGVARSLTALSKRDKYPESRLWETEEGQAWLRRMVIAMLYEFGVKGNQGAERMSEFLKRIRVDTHVGSSPSALRNIVQQLEKALADFQREQETQQAEPEGSVREIVASGDETFFNDEMVMVLMDLTSGYLLLEEEAADRSYKTWEAKVQPRLRQLGMRVRHFISDRGKSLVKLALSSLGCEAGADLFHAQYDISKWLGRALHGKLGRACKQLQDTEAGLASLKEKEAVPEKIAEQKQRIQQMKEELNAIEEEREAYHETQLSVSEAVHAFSVEDSTLQTSEQVEKRLEEQAQRFEEIAQGQNIQDKKDAAGKFRRQIEDLASIVDTWWLWTKESLSEYEVDEAVREWLLYVLLPVIYWYHQLHKTQNPDMKERYEAAWKKAHAAFAAHPVTRTMSKQDSSATLTTGLDRWRSWGEWASGNFHRASSAVEGRNGCLSQSYHNGRGLTNLRLHALTAIHNYDTRRHDGSTPAQRLYGKPFPDLFEWLLGQMGALPLPRKARQHVVKNPLALTAVAA